MPANAFRPVLAWDGDGTLSLRALSSPARPLSTRTLSDLQRAGIPSVKLNSPRQSPAARPSELHTLLKSRSYSLELPAVSPRQSSNTLGEHRQRSVDHARDKQEGHYAIKLFGVQPDIDFTFKRCLGDYSPRQGQRPRNGGAGSRSTFTNQCEALMACRSFGVRPSVEAIDRRGAGSCSPKLEGHDVDSFRKRQYHLDCNRLGISDINEICKLGTGKYSPRHSLSGTSSKETPRNLVSMELRLAQEPFRRDSVRVAAQPESEDASPKQETPRLSPKSTKKACPWVHCAGEAHPILDLEIAVLDPDEQETLRWARSTSASRARNARDLSEVRTMSPPLRRQCPPAPSAASHSDKSPNSASSTGSTSQRARSARPAGPPQMPQSPRSSQQQQAQQTRSRTSSTPSDADQKSPETTAMQPSPSSQSCWSTDSSEPASSTRIGLLSPTAWSSFSTGSSSGSSQCADSSRLVHDAFDAQDSVFADSGEGESQESLSQCTHSCRLGSQPSRCSWSIGSLSLSTSTDSSQCVRSRGKQKLAGDVLSGLKFGRPLPTEVKSSTPRVKPLPVVIARTRGAGDILASLGAPNPR